jgi:SAM-dependent methyltransferase
VPATPLTPPSVPAGLYDETYFRQWCVGYQAWEDSGGSAADPRYEWSLRRARLRPGERVLDVGCGRGELLAAALKLGAKSAIGVDYAPDAVELARRTLAAHDAGPAAEVRLADARALPVQDASVDLVTLLDVVEHLTPPELDHTLGEVKRVLVPGGRVLVHTFPNRLVYTVTYRLQRHLRPGRARRWPADPRLPYERDMHVNEQTRRSLARALTASGLREVRVVHGAWIHTTFLPDTDPGAAALYHRLARHRLTRPLGSADLWGDARR